MDHGSWVMVRQECVAGGVCRVPCQQLGMLLQCCFAGGAWGAPYPSLECWWCHWLSLPPLPTAGCQVTQPASKMPWDS